MSGTPASLPVRGNRRCTYGLDVYYSGRIMFASPDPRPVRTLANRVPRVSCIVVRTARLTRAQSSSSAPVLSDVTPPTKHDQRAEDADGSVLYVTSATLRWLHTTKSGCSASEHLSVREVTSSTSSALHLARLSSQNPAPITVQQTGPSRGSRQPCMLD